MLNPLEPGLSYPSSPPPPPPVHSVFANYDYGYYQQQQAISNRQHTPTGQPERMSGSSKRKMEDQVPSSSPLSSTSCSSSASFPEENDRAPSVKRSRRVAPKTARRQSSTNTTVSEDSESDEAESRQRSLERNRLAASKCRQRKKEWIDELAHKAEKMTRENEYLKQMLVQLKEETLYLKSQLIMHKNNDMNPCQNKPFINLF
ncbi:Skn-1-like basic-leucine zipper transcription factor [Mucor lusitanicus CBS 277.49]|uniref:Skn-1-like basic-leucine zipper transcription factor n=2 Tax=Mucor circinelloides f. lusitanicus TaxID=29924 RepID=A0A168LU62_MUCCL|nr:Skn-1-like basic-leucine zipper transcription factor [Mucor lusitanicus CBS 277.49]